jgi:hypothetical protein
VARQCFFNEEIFFKEIKTVFDKTNKTWPEKYSGCLENIIRPSFTKKSFGICSKFQIVFVSKFF